MIRQPVALAVLSGMLILAAGCGMPSLLITPVAGHRALRESVIHPGTGWAPGKIVIIEVEGLLLNARTGGLLQPGENDVSLLVEQLQKAEADPAVRGIVLRINSPGGTVSASDVMYQNVLKFRERSGKPVVAAAQDVAASGGYYVACAADQIIVQPTSVVGSVGVIFNTIDVSGTLAKIGARTEAIKSGPLKDLGSPFKPLSIPERRIMQGMVDEYHARFVEIIRTRRGLDERRLPEVGDGRIFSGRRAAILGLADNVGLLEDALDLAKELADAPGAAVVLYKRPYGYTGSIYAGSETPAGQTPIILNVPPSRALLPTGFYYLWEP